jgi:hypothetical protein
LEFGFNFLSNQWSNRCKRDLTRPLSRRAAPRRSRARPRTPNAWLLLASTSGPPADPRIPMLLRSFPHPALSPGLESRVLPRVATGMPALFPSSVVRRSATCPPCQAGSPSLSLVCFDVKVPFPHACLLGYKRLCRTSSRVSLPPRPPLLPPSLSSHRRLLPRPLNYSSSSSRTP